jgi:hypothetical protein
MEKVKQYFSIQGRQKMFYLLMALIVFVILDGILTEFLISGGRAWEANAFLAPLIGSVGFMLLKIFGALFCALVLWDVSRRHHKLASVVTWIAVIGYGGIVIWNTSLFLIT